MECSYKTKTVEQIESGPMQSEKAVRWVLPDYGGNICKKKMSSEPGMK